MRKFIFLLTVMFAFAISTTAQVKDSINGTAIEGLYIGQEYTSNEINGTAYDYIEDIYFLGQFYNTGRGIAVYAKYIYNEDDSTLVSADKNIRLIVPLNDSLVGQPNKHWFDLNIDENNAVNYGWMFWFTYTVR